MEYKKGACFNDMMGGCVSCKDICKCIKLKSPDRSIDIVKKDCTWTLEVNAALLQLVTSVNGKTGAVVLTTTDISEGTNLYFTTARARQSISGGDNVTYDNSTGVISVPTFPWDDITGVPSMVPSTRMINTTSPLTGGGSLAADLTLAINDAAADGTTKGAAAFTASDFNSSAGLISIDYANGQVATNSVNGFLSAADHTLFSAKESVLTFTSPLLRTVNTVSLAGLTGLGTANQVLGMNNAATAYEYKTWTVGSSGSAPAIVHTANTITLNIPLMAATGVTQGSLSSGTQSIPGIKIFTGNVSAGHTASPSYPMDLVQGFMRGKVRLKTTDATNQDILIVERNDGNSMWDLENVDSNTDLRLNSASRSNVIYFPRTQTTPALFFGTNVAPQDNSNGTGTSHVFANTSGSTAVPTTTCDMGLIVTDLGGNAIRGGGLEFWGKNVTNLSTTPGARIRTLYNTAGDRKFDLAFYVNNNTNSTQTGYQGLFEAVRIRYDGHFGIGVSNPLAYLHIKAGTASVNTAPIKLTSGTDLTAAEAGAFEYNGTRLAFSPSTTRKRVALTNDVAPANGQIPIGNGTDYTVANITGTNITVTNGAGTIALTRGDDNTPTVSSAGTLGLSTSGWYVFSGTTSTWTLPAIAGNTGKTYHIKNRGSGNITLNTNAGGNEIYSTSAVNTLTILPGEAYILNNDGTYFNIH